ncbi:PREDICTED: uncharacterized protein LOC109190436 [Ipomoea nil]|uniref:uncharacterized protein LOC109190436 n=1 Tax=Ipomoea nil TaxID=35883 RepID=UPI000901686F|nr:PREDICTED: uncharacterized protein LOC109190436 [Ipomoea nil]
MGNCVRKESSTEWGGEDWGSLSPHFGEDNKERFGKPGGREIKVKISKKQLAELVGKADVGGLSIHQLLAELMMNGGADLYQSRHHHRSWRPALQSIPEFS